MNTFEASSDYLYAYYRISPVVQEEEIFKFRECIFAILLLSPDVKYCNLSIWTNLILFHRDGILFTKFGWNWPSGSREEDFFLFRKYHYLENGGGIHLNKVESHFPKNDLCQVILIFPSGFGEEDF